MWCVVCSLLNWGRNAMPEVWRRRETKGSSSPASRPTWTNTVRQKYLWFCDSFRSHRHTRPPATCDGVEINNFYRQCRYIISVSWSLFLSCVPFLKIYSLCVCFLLFSTPNNRGRCGRRWCACRGCSGNYLFPPSPPLSPLQTLWCGSHSYFDFLIRTSLKLRVPTT